MEAVVVDAGSKLLKAGFAAPDQDPALVNRFPHVFYHEITIQSLHVLFHYGSRGI